MIDQDFVQAYTGYYPNDGTVSLRSLSSFGSSADSYAAGVDYTARKMPARRYWLAQLQLLGSTESCEWHLIYEEQATVPKPGDVIVDAADLHWHVHDVSNDVREAIRVCLCTRTQVDGL